jgi:hypothetical protein
MSTEQTVASDQRMPARWQIYVAAGQASTANEVVSTSVQSQSAPYWFVASLSASEVDWLEFTLLARQWKSETGMLSSRSRKASSRFYRRIIEMGRDRAVPQIIRHIQSEGATPSHWWPALQELTGEDPVPDAAKKDLAQVASHWTEWGRAHYARELGPR